MTLGDFVRAYRAEHDISMQDFANQCGLSKAYISILERNINPSTGKPPIPSLETIRAVASVIGIDFNDIILTLDKNQTVALEASDAVPPVPQKKQRAKAPKTIATDTSPTLRAIVASFQQLNEDGQKKVCEYAEDLVSSGRYKNSPCSRGDPAKVV